jgi:hypothetical protein
LTAPINGRVGSTFAGFTCNDGWNIC